MIRKSVVSSDDVGTPRRCRCQVARRSDCANIKPQDAQTVPMSSHKMPRLCQCQATRCPDCATVKPQDALTVPQDAQAVPMSSHKMPRLCHCQATRCQECATVKPQDAQTVPLSSHKMPRLCNKMPRPCQCQATRLPDSLSGNTPLRKRVQFPAQQHPADRRTHFHKRSDCQDTRSFRRCRCQSFPAGSRAATLAVSWAVVPWGSRCLPAVPPSCRAARSSRCAPRQSSWRSAVTQTDRQTESK